MKKLDLYILRQISVPALLALTVISLIASMREIQDRAHDFALFITLSDVVRLMLLFLPLLISLIIPMTFLFGFLMALGRLAQQQEIIAMQAAGLSFKRIAAPVVVTGILLSALCFVIQDRVQPWSVQKAFELIYSELPARATVDRLQAGVMHEYEGWRVYFAERSPDGNRLSELDLVQPGDETTAPAYFHAAAAEVERSGEGYVLVLKDGHVITGDHMRVEFGELRLELPAPSAWRPRNLRKMQTLSGLLREEESLTAAHREAPTEESAEAVIKERNEIAERLCRPFAVLACTLAGAPLGVRASSRGRSYAFAAGAGIVLVYAVLSMVWEPTGVRPLSTVIVRAWSPNLALIFGGFALWWRVDRVG